MNIGLVITVKNEERLLRTNVLYHKAIGISTIFVYFDNSTDKGRQSIKDIKDVFCLDSVATDTYAHLEYLHKFTNQADTMHSARQCLNTFDAMQRCKTLKVDWLLSMDADELFLSTIDGSQKVTDFFDLYQDFDVVQLFTLEVVGRQMAYDNVMGQETLFKSQSRFKHWNDRINLKIPNPYAQKVLKHPVWLGHTMGKCAVNVHSGLIPKNVHRFKAVDDGLYKVVNSGFMLHYYQYDFDDFIKKFKNFKHLPDYFLSGNSIPNLTKVWRDMVNDPNYGDDYLKDYYQSYLHMDSKKLKRFYSTRVLNLCKRKEPAVVEITYPKEVINSISL